MPSSTTYRRPAFPNRPWITGKLYDDHARSTVIHMDAYTFMFRERDYLVIDWRQGGFKRIALDGYLLELDGLTPVWDIEPMWLSGLAVYVTQANRAIMRRVHATVLAQPARMIGLGRGAWSRVSVQCHYVMAADKDCEIKTNKYRERAPYTPRKKPLALLDVL